MSSRQEDGCDYSGRTGRAAAAQLRMQTRECRYFSSQKKGRWKKKSQLGLKLAEMDVKQRQKWPDLAKARINRWTERIYTVDINWAKMLGVFRAKDFQISGGAGRLRLQLSSQAFIVEHSLKAFLGIPWRSVVKTFTAEGSVSIPGWGIKIPQAPRHGQKKKNHSYGESWRVSG